METSTYLSNNAMGWLIAIPVVAVENLIALVIISSRKRWKSPDVLLFSITLGHVLSLSLPLLLYAVIVYEGVAWTNGSCKFLVWCVMSFRIVGAVNIAFISLDRVWTLKWPSSYRAHNSSRQTSRTAVFMWLFGVAIGTIPLISWSPLESDQGCSLVLNIAGYGYAMCIVIIVLGSVMVSTSCIVTIVVNVVCIIPLLEEHHHVPTKTSIPRIVIESETGERTSATAGTRDSQNQQIYLLVSAVVILYFCVNGLPFVVINIIAFSQTTPADWMSVTITWCSIVTAFLHPPLLVLICNRYKKVCQRLYRSAGETCGCIKVEMAGTTINGLTRQETFDSLDDFSSDEDDKLHFPAPDWSEHSFSGSLDEGASTSSDPSTASAPASTSTAIQTTVTIDDLYATDVVVKNGRIPTPVTTPSTTPSPKKPRSSSLEYDNAAFEVEDENRKRSRKQRSPKMTPEQKRAMWQGHRGARKRLEALKQANEERASASKASASKGKKHKSRSASSTLSSEAKETDNKTLKVEPASPLKNRHRKLERLSQKQRSLDSLTIPTKQKTPFLSSRSLDQENHTLTVKVDVEKEGKSNRVRLDTGKELGLDDLKIPANTRSPMSDSGKHHGNKKGKHSSVKGDSEHKHENGSAQKKENIQSKSGKNQKANAIMSSPSSSPDKREKRTVGENAGVQRCARSFEIARENYNSDFSSFGSGELYDIPEESPEEVMEENPAGWNAKTVRALKAQHRDDVNAKGTQSPGGERKVSRHRHKDRQRARSVPDQNTLSVPEQPATSMPEKQTLSVAAPEIRESPPMRSQDKKPPRRALSRQFSQDHSRSFDTNSFEMAEFNGSRDSAIGMSSDINLDKHLSFSKVQIEQEDERFEVDISMPGVVTHPQRYQKSISGDGVVKDSRGNKHSIEADHPEQDTMHHEEHQPATNGVRTLVLDDTPISAADDSHSDSEDSPTRTLPGRTRAWTSPTPTTTVSSSLSSPSSSPSSSTTTTGKKYAPSDPRGRLGKSLSGGERPSARDLRERYRKSHLSMAAIFQSIRDDTQEVVYL